MGRRPGLWPVFFQQTDVCLVTRAGFKIMTELNPQLGRQLRMIATSIPLIPAGFYFRNGCASDLQNQMGAQLCRLHTTLAGGQFLTIFQTERIVEAPFTCLTPSLALLTKHCRRMQRSKVATTALLGPEAPGMGGNLRAASGGRGLGAAFTLELPVAVKQEN